MKMQKKRAPKRKPKVQTQKEMEAKLKKDYEKLKKSLEDIEKHQLEYQDLFPCEPPILRRMQKNLEAVYTKTPIKYAGQGVHLRRPKKRVHFKE